MKRIFLYLSVFIFNAGFLSAQSDDDYIVFRFKDHGDVVNASAFSTDGSMLATGGEDKQVFVYDVKTGEKLYHLRDFYYPIKDLSFTRTDDLMITSGSAVKTVNMQGEEIDIYPSLATHIYKFSLSPDNTKLASGTYHKKVKIIDAISGEMLQELDGHDKSAMAVAFSPDCKIAVTGSSDMTVIKWDISTGEALQKVKAHADNIFDIVFHPSGKVFATCSGDKIIKLWKTADCSYIRSFIGHDFPVVDIEFTRDGNYLISAGYDNSVNVWDLKSGQSIYTYYSQEDAINTIAVSPDDKLLAAGAKDKTVIVYKLLPYVAVDNVLYEETEKFKTENDIFTGRKKGEKREAYEERKNLENKRLDVFYKELYERVSLEKEGAQY